MKKGVTNITASGAPKVNQNPNPWIISTTKNMGNKAIWIYPNTWNHFSLTHFVEVIAISKIIISNIIPVIPGKVLKSNSWYVGIESNTLLNKKICYGFSKVFTYLFKCLFIWLISVAWEIILRVPHMWDSECAIP